MRLTRSGIELSATDLAHFLACRHRTALELAAAQDLIERPSWIDPALEILRQRGLAHERRYLETLRAQGLLVADLSGEDAEAAAAGTVAAMRSGAAAVVQAFLREGRWAGRPDVLRRVESPSALGGWSYEAVGTNLGAETRGGRILQLALHSDLLRAAQGKMPAQFHIVAGDPATPLQSFRVEDYAAYFRQVRDQLQAASELPAEEMAAANYPERVEHCEICRWRTRCERRRREDDHLSLVAGIWKWQAEELRAAGIGTVAALGTTPIPLPFEPRRGAAETYVRAREQARIQLEGRLREAPVHELLPVAPGQGLSRLPPPSAGDLFLHFRGDPFAREGGREYLFGLATFGADGAAAHSARWAHSDAEERGAFQNLIDRILAAWAVHRGMHVYHFAPYEPAALKRLMGRHATREDDIDRMLRAGLFVDLYVVVKQALRASVESYSIEALEPFYGFTRGVPLEDARMGIRVVERALEAGAPEAVIAEVREAVEGCNKDDCISLKRLQQWLESLRRGLEVAGARVPRPAPSVAEAEKVSERDRRVHALTSALTAGVPADRERRTEEQRAMFLLAHLLGWHRRESKGPWWEFFRLRDLPEEDLIDERDAIAELKFVGRLPEKEKERSRSPVDRYSFPPQDTALQRGDLLHLPDGTDFGKVERIDTPARFLEVRKRLTYSDVHPRAVFAHPLAQADEQAAALLRIGEHVARHGIVGEGPYRAARDLILRRPPRLRSGPFRSRPGESASDFAARIALDLDSTVLPIQAPPGAGQTHAAARMILDLVRRGLRVAVTGKSHKVIRHLLETVCKAAHDVGMEVTCGHKVSSRSPGQSSVQELTDNDDLLARLREGRVQVGGGTAWVWSRAAALDVLDALFVAEAAQMPLADVLAVSQAAKSIVLLGDPQKLQQPSQGSHPEGTDASALEHLFGGQKTIPEDRGIFLPVTWRLAPAICRFTSETFYQWRLEPRAGLERQVLSGTGLFDGAGLWAVPVVHEGNHSSSREEAAVIERIVAGLLRPEARWSDGAGRMHELTPDDVVVLSPYNAQAGLLAERLSAQGARRVGTVEKLQGEEAPVVIYSTAASSPEEAPHGMEFLYSLNRLNVATSRARCACILVASPRLFEPDCKSARQMHLANAYCRYRELAKKVEIS